MSPVSHEKNPFFILSVMTAVLRKALLIATENRVRWRWDWGFQVRRTDGRVFRGDKLIHHSFQKTQLQPRQ
jgi:hypothetical protein